MNHKKELLPRSLKSLNLETQRGTASLESEESPTTDLVAEAAATRRRSLRAQDLTSSSAFEGPPKPETLKKEP